MPGEEEYEQQMKLLQAYRSRLADQLIQSVRLGEDTPHHILEDIREAREHIKRIKCIIREWGFEVSENPIDEEVLYQSQEIAPPRLPKLVQPTARKISEPKAQERLSLTPNSSTREREDGNVLPTLANKILANLKTTQSDTKEALKQSILLIIHASIIGIIGVVCFLIGYRIAQYLRDNLYMSPNLFPYTFIIIGIILTFISVLIIVRLTKFR